MSKIIELQDKRTWTKELKDSIYQKHNFDAIIQKYKIVGYHYTNLINIDDVFKNGIKGLNTKVIRNIKDNINMIYPEKIEVINKSFEDYIRKYNFDNRKNKIFFCCDNKQINNGFDYIFKYYGGEVTYNVFNNDILGKELLLNIGKPYIIKFLYNFNDLDCYRIDNLKQKMINKLLNNKNIELDFSIENNVETQDILGAYEVQRLNYNYSIKRYIANKNFNNI